MKTLFSPLVVSRKPPLAALAYWLLLAEVALLALIAGSSGFAVAWFAINDEATLRIHPQSGATQPALPAANAAPVAHPCLAESFIAATDSRTCLSIN
ncbi:hypothetical protein C7271_00985 [filamentous cyanobacterium CCP5]|nr:hypothetical protein C7271_00985 [filamentous cyanobacterium CCP5]